MKYDAISSKIRNEHARNALEMEMEVSGSSTVMLSALCVI